MNTALLPGSFDPPTLGHLDVILRSEHLCQKLIVGIAQNVLKKDNFFSPQERIDLLKQMLKGKKNIEVVLIEDLVVNFAKTHNVDFLIRGLRPFSDVEKEFQMALANKKIGDIETVFLMADTLFAHISSTLIREVALGGHHLKDFVPEAIENAVSDRLSRRNSSSS